MLDEDGVAGQVAVDDGGVAGVEVTAEGREVRQRTPTLSPSPSPGRRSWTEDTHLRADRICVHHLFKA